MSTMYVPQKVIIPKREEKHVCGLQGFGRGRDGLDDRCPACEAPKREERKSLGQAAHDAFYEFADRSAWPQIHPDCRADWERVAEAAVRAWLAEVDEGELADFIHGELFKRMRSVKVWHKFLQHFGGCKAYGAEEQMKLLARAVIEHLKGKQ